MALIKDSATRYGAAIRATYHRIVGFEVNYTMDTCRVALAGYADETARRQDANPLSVAAVELRLSDLGGADPTRAGMYEAIKGQPAWMGAADT